MTTASLRPSFELAVTDCLLQAFTGQLSHLTDASLRFAAAGGFQRINPFDTPSFKTLYLAPELRSSSFA